MYYTKKRFFYYKRSSLLLKFLFSYVGVLIIPLFIIGTIVYAKFFNILESEIKNSSKTIIEQTKIAMDIRIRELDQLAYQLSVNPNILELMYNSTIDRESKAILMKNIIKELNVYAAAKGKIDAIGIYFQDDDIVLSGQTKSDPEFFYNRFAKYENLDYKDWFEAIRQVTQRQYWPAAWTLNEGSVRKKVITYVQSIPFNSTYSYATLIVLMDENSIWPVIDENNLLSESIIGIVDQENRIIATMDNNVMPYTVEQINNAIIKRSSGITVMGHDKKHITIHTTSGVIDWKYIMLIPESELLMSLSNIKLIFVYTMVFCMIIGISVSVLLSYKNYKPIKRILQVIRLNQTEAEKNSDSEYSTIITAVQNAYYEKKEMELILEKQLPFLRAGFLIRLLKQNMVNSEEIGEMFKMYHVNFTLPHFVVAVIHITEVSSKTCYEGLVGINLSRVVLSNICNDIMNSYFKTYIVEIDERTHALMINTASECSDLLYPVLEEAFQKIISIANEKYQMLLNIGVGRFCNDTAKVYKSFNESMVALNCGLAKRVNHIMFYQHVKGSNHTVHYSFEQENQLINSIRAGSWEAGERILKEIYHIYMIEGNNSIEFINCVLYSIKNTLLRVLGDLQKDYLRFVTPEMDILEEVGQGNVNDEYIKISNLCRYLCDTIAAQKNQNGPVLKKQILQYIQENYSDSDVSLAKVASYFNITPVYLSRYFKEQTGSNFNDYINRFRIEQGKKLLLSENMTLLGVALQIGFTNINTFIRLFKKYENITPTQYKECNKLSLQDANT